MRRRRKKTGISAFFSQAYVLALLMLLALLSGLLFCKVNLGLEPSETIARLKEALSETPRQDADKRHREDSELVKSSRTSSRAIVDTPHSDSPFVVSKERSGTRPMRALQENPQEVKGDDEALKDMREQKKTKPPIAREDSAPTTKHDELKSFWARQRAKRSGEAVDKLRYREINAEAVKIRQMAMFTGLYFERVTESTSNAMVNPMFSRASLYEKRTIMKAVLQATNTRVVYVFNQNRVQIGVYSPDVYRECTGAT